MYHQRRYSWAQMVIFDRLADVELVFSTARALPSPSSAEGLPHLMSDCSQVSGSEVAHQISTCDCSPWKYQNLMRVGWDNFRVVARESRSCTLHKALLSFRYLVRLAKAIIARSRVLHSSP
jgi:hypothetical protein